MNPMIHIILKPENFVLYEDLKRIDGYNIKTGLDNIKTGLDNIKTGLDIACSSGHSIYIANKDLTLKDVILNLMMNIMIYLLILLVNQNYLS
jgi:hypothetical protein